MNFETAILTRRSVRKFIPCKIEDEMIKTILTAGFHAPTAGNKRPVHFIVIKNREILKILSEAKQEAEMINSAELAIVVCGDKNIQPYHDFLHEDCAASIENMLLCIHGNGLGAVWCGVPHILEDCFELYKNTLNLPENIIPVGTIAIGGIGEEKGYIDRYENKKIHYEKW